MNGTVSLKKKQWLSTGGILGRHAMGKDSIYLCRDNTEDLVNDLGGATEPIVSMGQQEGFNKLCQCTHGAVPQEGTVAEL